MKNTNKKRAKLLKGQSDFTQLPKKFIYLNNGTEGSMPGSVIKALHKSLKKWANNPTDAYEIDPLLGKRQKKNRAAIAQFMGVQLNNICLTENTTMGLNMVLMGLDFKPEDKLVITDHEHPSITSPMWILKEKLGLQVVVRDFPQATELSKMNAEQLIEHLFPNVPELQNAKALCISHVYNTTGVRLPLDKIRQRADELNIRYLIVDGAQGMGMVDLNKAENRVDNCDFYAAPTHKWMNGPPGTGVLYIKDVCIGPPEFYPPLSQKMAAYKSADDSQSHLPMAEALMVRGCCIIPAYVAITKKLLKFFNKIGGQLKVEQHILALSSMVRDFIAQKSPAGLISATAPELQSGLVSFYPFNWDQPQTCFKDKDTVIGIVDKLLEQGVQVRYVPFPTVDFSDHCKLQCHDPHSVRDCSGEPVEQTFAIRVSSGYFNTPADIRVFRKKLKKVLKGLGE